MIRYANRCRDKVRQHQAINRSTALPAIGGVSMRALWPPFTGSGSWDDDNENNNSVVLALTLGEVTFLLTGDCEASNWDQIAGELAGLPGLSVFQVPHHGAFNGVFAGADATPWLDALPTGVRVAMSSHIRPHKHPAPEVVNELAARPVEVYRTDRHYHLTFSTDGTVDPVAGPNVDVSWSHI
jgi:competence protein ComEC